VDRQTSGQVDRQTRRQADRQTSRQADKQTGRQVVRQTSRQADKQTGRQADRQQMDWFRVPSKFRSDYFRECLWADCIFGSVSAKNIKNSSVSGSA